MSKEGKIYQLLRAIPDGKREELGLKVEALIKGDLSFIVNKYRMRYSYATQATFGWDEDDLMQYIRMALWKGVATYDPTKRAKETTYLSRILEYAFANLAKKCNTKKHSLSKLYFPDQMFITEELTIDETAEDWLQYARSFAAIKDQITKSEMSAFATKLHDGDYVTELDDDQYKGHVDDRRHVDPVHHRCAIDKWTFHVISPLRRFHRRRITWPGRGR